VESQGTLYTQRVAGTLLALSFVVCMVGVVMFSARDGTAGQPAPSFAYFAVERGLFVGAVVIAALGLAALAALVGEVHGDVLVPARLAAATYAIATVVLLIGEASGLRSEHPPYVLIVAYVLLAFLAQAAFGALLARTGFLPAWIGWAAIVWNVGWLVVLPIITPGDIYFPVLHHPIPLLVGIALLRRG
jgi:hypothetical protein